MVKDFEVYTNGLCYASVCTKYSVEEATAKINFTNPTGVTPWKHSPDNFRNGGPNPGVCEDNPSTHKHYLFEC